jgi:hypothetical protein
MPSRFRELACYQAAAFHQEQLWVSASAIARRDLGHTREYVSLETMGALER